MSYDDLIRRCPKLGGEVSFGYCRKCGDKNEACHKVFDCWWERFDVVDYFRSNLTPRAFQRLAAEKPAPKIVNLVDLIQQARRQTKKSLNT